MLLLFSIITPCFYESTFCRDVFSKYFFDSIFVNFWEIPAAHQRNILKNLRKFIKKTPVAKSYFSKITDFYKSIHWRCSAKKVFLGRCSHNSQGNICVRNSILIKLPKAVTYYWYCVCLWIFELFKTNVCNLTKLFVLQTFNWSEKLKCNMGFCKVAVIQFG